MAGFHSKLTELSAFNGFADFPLASTCISVNILRWFLACYHCFQF